MRIKAKAIPNKNNTITQIKFTNNLFIPAECELCIIGFPFGIKERNIIVELRAEDNKGYKTDIWEGQCSDCRCLLYNPKDGYSCSILLAKGSLQKAKNHYVAKAFANFLLKKERYESCPLFRNKH